MTAPRTERRERPLTVEEFERLPEEDAYRIELVRGMVVREPRPAAEHGRILFNFSALLRDHALRDARLAVLVPTDQQPSVERAPRR